jgi:hypothetical protein
MYLTYILRTKVDEYLGRRIFAIFIRSKNVGLMNIRVDEFTGRRIFVVPKKFTVLALVLIHLHCIFSTAVSTLAMRTPTLTLPTSLTPSSASTMDFRPTSSTLPTWTCRSSTETSARKSLFILSGLRNIDASYIGVMTSGICALVVIASAY